MTAPVPTAEDVVRALLDAFNRQDRATIEALLDPACTWTVPGRNGLAGTYAGRDEILGLFGTLKRLFTVPARFELLCVATAPDRVMTYQYGVITVDGRELRMKEVLVCRVVGGRVLEVEEFQADQAGFDETFTEQAVARARQR